MRKKTTLAVSYLRNLWYWIRGSYPSPVLVEVDQSTWVRTLNVTTGFVGVSAYGPNQMVEGTLEEFLSGEST